MNAWPTLREWWQFAGTLALELVIVFVAAKLATLRLRSASWRRAVWQMTMVAMLLVTVGELNGVRSWLHAPQQTVQTAPQRKVIVTIKDADPALFNEADFTEATPGNVEPVLRRSQWQQHTRWPVIIWLIVATPLLGRLLLAQWLALAMRFFSPRITDETTNAKARRLAGTLGISRQFVLLASKRAIAPFTFGVWLPAIVLPQNFSATFTPEQQDVALAHELAHVAGLDSAWRAFSQFTCALLWWHPLVWLAKRELDHASELVADESSLLLADGPDRLAECLLACARQLRRPALAGWLGMDGGGFRSALGKRVARLLQLQSHNEVSRRVPWYLRVVAPAVCAALLWFSVAVAVKDSNPAHRGWRGSVLGTVLTAAEVKSVPAQPAKAETEGKQLPERNPLDEERADRFRKYLEANKNGVGAVGGTKVSPPSEATNSTASPPTDPRRQAILEKLRQTRLKEWGPIDNLSLSEVVRQLDQEMRRIAPDGAQVNFFFVNSNTTPAVEATDPAGLPLPAPTPVDLNGISVRLGKALRDLSFEEVLNILVIIAETKIQYSVEPFGILISPKTKERVSLHTRFFRIDPSTLQQSLNSMQPPISAKQNSRSILSDRRGGQLSKATPFLTEVVPAESVIPMVRKWFTSMGVDLSAPGKAVYFNERLGSLMVRATLEELDAIEKGIQFASMSPPQLTIRVKVMEVERDGKGWPGFDLYLGSVGPMTNNPPGSERLATASPSGQWPNTLNEGLRRPANELTVAQMRTNTPQAPTITGILTDAQFRSVVKALEQRGGTDLLSAPTVTTESGRQAQIKVVDIKYIVTDLDVDLDAPKGPKPSRGSQSKPNVSVGGADNGSIVQPIAEPFELGPVIDVTPRVMVDGYTIHMTIQSSLKEFLGYDDPGDYVSRVRLPGSTNVLSTPTPLPKFRMRSVTTSAKVFDGQTMVFNAGTARHLKQERLADGTTTNTFTEKELFYFITPRLIDAAGNALHAEEELPYHKGGPTR